MLVTIILGTALVTPSVVAKSSGRDSTPKSMRGTWYKWMPKTEYSNGHVYKDKVPAKQWLNDYQGYMLIGVWRQKFKGKTGYCVGGAASTTQSFSVLTKVKVNGKYHKVVVSYVTDQIGDYGEIQYDFRNKLIAKKYGKKHTVGYYENTVNSAKIKKQMKKVVIKYFGKKYLYHLS